MRLALQICHYVIWFPLAVLVIAGTLRYGIRRYPLLFIYMTVTLLFAVAEMPSALSVSSAHYTPEQAALHKLLYAIAQVVTHLLLFSLVGSMVLRATEESPLRNTIRRLLAVGASLFIVTSFFVHYYKAVAMGQWLPPWTRDMNFAAAIIDMVLWALLLSSKRRDQSLLLLASGLGIMFAGDAITDAVRSIAVHYKSVPIWISASVFSMLTDGASLFVMWQAVRRSSSPQPPTALFAQPATKGRP
jgi:hypothetical protein